MRGRALPLALVAPARPSRNAHCKQCRWTRAATAATSVRLKCRHRRLLADSPSYPTEASVENGDGNLVKEFEIQGAPKQILLRALGPSPSVGNPLADPTLEVENANGALIASNENWRSDQEAEIQATGLAAPLGLGLEERW